MSYIHEIDYPIPVKTLSAPSRPATTDWDLGYTGTLERRRVVSLSIPSPDLVATQFLRQSRGKERYYWADPRGKRVFAGAGVATELVVPPVLPLLTEDHPPSHRFKEIEQQARELFSDHLVRELDPGSTKILDRTADDSIAGPRLFGGFSFQDDFIPDQTWSVFNPAEFILPHYQFTQLGDERFLTINTLISPDDDLEETLIGLREALLARRSLPVDRDKAEIPSPLSVRYPMTQEQWGEMIQRATGAIGEDQFEKVVLARVCEVRSSSVIDAVSALEFLGISYKNSFRFLFEPRTHHAFYGATPELLVRKSGSHIETMALAGSIARGTTAEENRVFASQLLSSAKDRHEHDLVVTTIRRHLAELTHNLTISDAPEVLQLHNIQHLLTPISGQVLDPEITIFPFIEKLHPTPALGGVPSGEALAFLRDSEPVPRGWYAGPVGWVDSDLNGEFAVAIRSAVTQHDRAWLYAGAGLVSGSTPEREWQETALKFRPMLEALGAGNLV